MRWLGFAKLIHSVPVSETKELKKRYGATRESIRPVCVVLEPGFRASGSLLFSANDWLNLNPNPTQPNPGQPYLYPYPKPGCARDTHRRSSTALGSAVSFTTA